MIDNIAYLPLHEQQAERGHRARTSLLQDGPVPFNTCDGIEIDMVRGPPIREYLSHHWSNQAVLPHLHGRRLMFDH
jgi:hypothetical protein